MDSYEKIYDIIDLTNNEMTDNLIENINLHHGILDINDIKFSCKSTNFMSVCRQGPPVGRHCGARLQRSQSVPPPPPLLLRPSPLSPSLTRSRLSLLRNSGDRGRSRALPHAHSRDASPRLPPPAPYTTPSATLTSVRGSPVTPGGGHLRHFAFPFCRWGCGSVMNTLL